LSDGGRYDFASSTWNATTSPGAPAARERHTAIWTGSEMIVWGGRSGTYYLNTGARYNPVLNTWTALPTTGAPSGRSGHTAVWTGTEMIVWGGQTSILGSLTNSGGRYNPKRNTWTALATTGTLSPRAGHTAVWTGSEMIVWGGANNLTNYADGRRYDPSLNTWGSVATTAAPAKRAGHTAVWTGREMIVWGGSYYSGLTPTKPYFLRTGARYDPSANTWNPFTTTGAPAGRDGHTAIWTGGEMIVWGGDHGTGYYNGGGRYYPTANSWFAMTSTGAPAARSGHVAVWTGSRMLIWGGYDGGRLNDLYAYTPGGPPLRMIPAGAHTAILARPYASEGYLPGFVLQQSPAAGAGNWTAVTSLPARVGDECQVTVSTASGNKFFRLFKP
jgi:N-acetylneuraminic acid mutarotase